MDRRQRKTRQAIFAAFSQLLNEKDFSKITAGEIMERADVGRATFYAHFETKDFLLKELCEELFCHIFDMAGEGKSEHRHIFECSAPQSEFVHLFSHLRKNDNNVLCLLSSPNNHLFLKYFKSGLKLLVESRLDLFEKRKSEKLPEQFWINHILSTFVETLQWWIENGMRESEEEICEYFFLAV